MNADGKSIGSSSSAGVVAVPKAVEEAFGVEDEEIPTTTATGSKMATITATTQQANTSSKKKKKGQQQQQQLQLQGTAGSDTNKEKAKAVAAKAPPEDSCNKTDKKDTTAATAAATTSNVVKPVQASLVSQKSSHTSSSQPQQSQLRLLPFQPYAGIPPFNQLRDTNLQDWPPGRGLTFIRPCPSGTSSLEKLGMLKNCPQILAYIQSFSGADWMEATFTPHPCIRITATTQMPGGKSTAEAILRLSDEMILQWLHRFDPQVPIWAMFVCPAMLSGLMVGKQALNLKKIEEISMARVWAAPRDVEAQYVSFFICSNNYEATREAYAMLESRAHNQMEMAMATNMHQQQHMPATKATAGPVRIQKPSSATSSSSVAATSGDIAKKNVMTPVSSPSSISSCSDDDSSSTDTEASTQQPSRDSTPPATHATKKPTHSSSASSSSSLASTTTTKGSDSRSTSSTSTSSDENIKSDEVTSGVKANHQSATPTKKELDKK
ncbi:hypothetical protein VYU27_001557 [Nannochloropsis oceanica]